MIDLTNGNRKAILTIAQVVSLLGMAFGLGMVWRDVVEVKRLIKLGIYSKQEVDAMQLTNYQADLILANEIVKLQEKVADRGDLNGVRIQASK